MNSPSVAKGHEVVIEIGGIPIAVQTADAGFVTLLTRPLWRIT